MINKAEPTAGNLVAKCLRRLKWNERVRVGDFVDDGQAGFESWTGPSGFRADAFVKTIYRRLQPAAVKKSP